MGSGGGGDWERVSQRAVAAVRRGDGVGADIFGIFCWLVGGWYSGDMMIVVVFDVYIVVICC